MKYQSRPGTNVVDEAWTATYRQKVANVDTWAPGTLMKLEPLAPCIPWKLEPLAPCIPWKLEPLAPCIPWKLDRWCNDRTWDPGIKRNWKRDIMVPIDHFGMVTTTQGNG
jgi:hypothetical protein